MKLLAQVLIPVRTPFPRHATCCQSLAVLVICAIVMLPSCSSARLGPAGTSRSALSCRAIGAFAGASHYGEHVRRPDPMENRTLARAQAIAQSALASVDRSHESSPARRITARLITAISDYRLAIEDGTGFNAALEQFRTVIVRFPSSCLANRSLPPN